MKISSPSIIALLLFNVPILYSQETFVQNTVNFQIKANPTTEIITVDGELNEPTWSYADKAENFWQTQPVDGLAASHKTIVHVAYDDKHLYVAAICYDDMDKQFVRTLKRDDWGASDEFGVLIDPFGQKSNAYLFGVNAAGGETEGLLSAPDDLI